MPPNKRQPDFDLDLAIGKQAELWVNDLIRALSGGSTIEVKAPKPFLENGSFYVETHCKRAKGWTKSGLNTTKAQMHVFAFGSLPGGLAVQTMWLKRAARKAYDLGHKIECTRGDYPTKGVLVSLKNLWETREHDP